MTRFPNNDPVIKIRPDLRIMIPKIIVEKLDVQKDDVMNLIIKNNSIILTPKVVSKE